MNTLSLKYFSLIFSILLSCNVFSQSVGGTTSGAASFCGSANSGFISLTGNTGSVLFWQSSVNGGPWTNIGNPTTTQTFVNLTQSTCYRAVVKQGTFPADTSSVSCVTIYAPTVAGSVSGGGTFCGGTGSGTVTLSGNTGSVISWLYSTDGGSTWNTISNTTTALTYTNITVNMLFEAVVQNSSFCAVDTSTKATFMIDPTSVAGIITLTGNDSVCYGLNNGSLNLNGNAGQVLGWLSSINGTTWSTITNTTTTQSFSNLIQSTYYKAFVKSGVCPNDTTASSKITVLPLPTVNAGIDSTILSGQSLTLNGSGSGTPFWLPATTLTSATIFNPVATPTVTTAYVLIVTNQYSCANADTVVITVQLPVFNGIVSNYFTPNGDGINDSWYIQDIQNYSDNEVFVYNIYGNQVYNKKGYLNDWKGTYNGNELPDGTYYYVLKFDNSDKVLKGSLDIVRKK